MSAEMRVYVVQRIGTEFLPFPSHNRALMTVGSRCQLPAKFSLWDSVTERCGCTYINRDVSIRFRYTLALLPPLRCGNAKSNVFRENRGEKSFSAK